jgi:cation:H+ antiporter
MIVTLVFFIAGLALLIVGAEALVRGASRLASAVGISPLVIGLTVVAFGTSSPELAISIFSAVTGKPDIALGNVVGSNIFNVLFILGASAIIVPLLVSQQLVRLDVPLMIVVSFLMVIMGYDGNIGRIEGLLLVAIGVAYTIFIIKKSYQDNKAANNNEGSEQTSESKSSGIGNLPVNLGFIIVGLVMLVFGSRFLVDSAITIAGAMGVSQLIIGLTIIAAGTSLPEVATSIMASIRGERDIAVGNVVGSNIFNILFVLGLSSIVAPNGLSVTPSIMGFDLPVMIAVAIACLPIFFTGNLIARWEGFVFLGYYLAYTLYLILDASEHDSLPVFNNIMALFVIPLTVLTIAIVVAREVHRNHFRIN